MSLVRELEVFRAYLQISFLPYDVGVVKVICRVSFFPYRVGSDFVSAYSYRDIGDVVLVYRGGVYKASFRVRFLRKHG